MSLLRPLRILMMSCLVLGVPAAASARSLHSAQMPDRVEVGTVPLRLTGMGVRKKYFLKVYVAGLYVPQSATHPTQAIDRNQPKQIRLTMLRDVEADKVRSAIEDGFQKNPSAEWKRLAPRLSQLKTLLRDLKKGETLVFTHHPGTGTTISSNGALLTTIPGDDFGRALFRVWIGPYPVDEELRDALLGK